MDFTTLFFLVLIFLVAMLYSSVGHGGASGYLAVMSLFQFTPEMMRPSALVLNVFVSLAAWWQYSRSEKMNVKLFLWLVAGSIPAAFFGATITLETTYYKRVLGAILLFQALRLTGALPSKKSQSAEPAWLPALVAGVVIGFISGLIGIGGGIILSPLLLMLGWTTMKETALISALFILVNSISAITGLTTGGVEFSSVLYLWITIALTGGLVGSWIGRSRLTGDLLRKILGVVLIIAGLKLVVM